MTMRRPGPEAAYARAVTPEALGAPAAACGCGCGHLDLPAMHRALLLPGLAGDAVPAA